MDRSFRKNSVVFFIFCSMSLTLFAGSDEEFFLRGNNQYKEGDYANALVSYEGITAKGRAVLYNMGNCYYYIKKYPQALLCWSRAERGASYSERYDIARNKELMLKEKGQFTVGTSAQQLYRHIIMYGHCVPLLLLQMLFLLLWYVIVVYLYKKRKKRTICVSAFICLIVVGFFLQAQYKESTTVRGVIMKEQTSLYAAPNTHFHILAQLPSAELVVITQQREGWYKVQYADTIGWIEAELIQTV